MINELVERGFLTVNTSKGRIIGYLFHGELYKAYLLLDSLLVELAEQEGSFASHSCNTLLPVEFLEKIGFFNKLPANPLFALPHILPEDQSVKLVLSPSTCYHTFATLENKTLEGDLVFYTAKGECHRYESEQCAPSRLVNFTMREFVLLGTPDTVMQSCDRIFERVLSFLNRVDNSFYQETANDVFYGENSVVTQKVQRVLGVKKEILSGGELGPAVSVGSRNYHRELFTTKFNIRAARLNTELHSSCVAFGMERLLLMLLSKMAGNEPHCLITQLNRAMLEGVQEHL